MKRILSIISFMLCHTSSYANSINLDDLRANIPQVKFDKKQMQYLGVEEYAQKNYVRRPVGEVNTFLGDYVTTFKVSLPKSYHFLSELNFEYNSSRIQNIGFGIGFSLILPRLIVKKDSLRIFGMTSGDLVQIEEKNELANSRVEQVLNRLQLADAKVTKYLSNNGNDNSVYLKIETSNLIRYIQLRPNNETYIFNGKGLILNAYNQNKKGIQFKYIEDILVEGFDYESEYSFEIKYQFSSTDLVFRNDKFLPKVLGIDHLIVKQGDVRKLVKFHYEEEYLKQVYVAGSKYNIFAAKYSALDSGSFGVKQVPAVYQPKNNSVLSYFSNKLDSKPEFKILSNDEYSYLIDVNNDMVLDKVVVNLKSKIDRANDVLKKLNYIKAEGNFYKINRKLSDLEYEINDFQERADVYLGQVDDSGEIFFKKDETMSGIVLPSKILKLELVDKKEKRSQTVGRGENQYEVEYYVQSINIKMNYLKSLKFIDIDNNGLKDIFLCNNNQIINDSNLKLVGKYKDFQQNLMSKYYYNLLLNKTDSLLTETDKADHIIYLFNDVKKIIAQGKGSNEKETLKNELLNTSYFEVSRLTNAITCNQTSIILDANNDGQLDLLTGNILTLLGNDGSSLNKKLTNDELGNYFEYPSSDLKILEYPVELIDSNNNSKFSFVEGFGTIVDRMDRSLIVTRPDSELRYYRPTPTKHLVKEYSKFSGTVELKYRYHLGSALVVEKILNNSVLNVDRETEVALTNGKKVKSVYSYQGSKIDERTNILLGHSSVLINNFSENLRGELVPNGFTKKTFLRDMSTYSHFYLLKAKRLGQIQRIENYSNESKLLSYTNYSYKEYPLSLNDRILNWLSAKESFLIGNSRGAIVERYSLKNPINGFVYLESETRNPKNKKILINKFNPLTLGLCLDYERHFSLDNDDKLTPDVQYSCDENGLVESKKVEDNEIEYKYDYLERLVSTRDSKGKVETFDYYNNSPLIKRAIVDEKEQVFDYEFISNRLIKFQENKGVTYRYTWSHGDDLETIIRNETILLKQKFSDNKVYLTLADEVFEITLDGFGELLKQVKVLNNNEKTLQKYHIVNADGRILRKDVSNDISKDIVSTDFVYDELGRLLSEVESGGYAKNYHRVLKNIYNEGELISIEMLDGRNKSKFNRSTKKKFNDASEIVSISSGSDGNDSEVVSFAYNDNGKLIRVKEDYSGLDSVYSYDLMGRISTSKASDVYNWNELHSEYSNNERLNISTVGTKKLDAYDRIVINENNSKKSHFLENSTFSVGDLVDTKIVYDQLELRNKYIYTDNELHRYELYSELKPLLSNEFVLDQFGRTSAEIIKMMNSSISLKYEFEDGALSKLEPFVSEIVYSDSDKVSSVSFSSGAALDFSFDHHGRLKESFLRSQSGEVFGLEMNEGVEHSTKLYFNKKFYNLKSKNQTYDYENNLNLAWKPVLLKNSKFLRQGSFVTWYNEFNFEVENDMTTVITHPKYGKINLYFDANKKWRGSCSKKQGQCNLENLFYKISNDEYFSHGSYIRAVKVQGQLIGVLVDNKFYPALVDQVGSLIALMSEDGKSLLFEREYSEWGEKLNVWGDKEFERKIPFAFAGLIQLPFFNGEILQSETRIYLPSLGIWQEADNLIKWNPESLLNAPGNWNPVVYAGNDPVNFVDPSGRAYQIPASLIGMGIGATIGGISEALMSNKTGVENLKDIGKGMLVGGTSGFFAGLTSGASLGSTFGIGGLLGGTGTAYRLALDDKNLLSGASRSKIAAATIIGAITAGLLSTTPRMIDKFLSGGLGLIESFLGGSASIVIDKVDQVHKIQGNYYKELKMQLGGK